MQNGRNRIAIIGQTYDRALFGEGECEARPDSEISLLRVQIVQSSSRAAFRRSRPGLQHRLPG